MRSAPAREARASAWTWSTIRWLSTATAAPFSVTAMIRARRSLADGRRSASPAFLERNVLLAGLALLVLALGLLTRLLVRADYTTDLLPVMLLAAGFGLALPALTTLGMSGADGRDAGLASGLFNTTQQIGMALGVAVLSTLAASRTESSARSGSTPAEALTSGYHLAFALGAALLLAATALAATLLRTLPPAPPAPARAPRVARRPTGDARGRPGPGW